MLIGEISARRVEDGWVRRGLLASHTIQALPSHPALLDIGQCQPATWVHVHAALCVYAQHTRMSHSPGATTNAEAMEGPDWTRSSCLDHPRPSKTAQANKKGMGMNETWVSMGECA